MEVSINRRRAALASALGIAFAVVGLLGSRRTWGQAPRPDEDSLRLRVDRYYTSLTKRDYKDIWLNFLASSMRRDTPQEQFVSGLSQSLGTANLTLLSKSSVKLDTTGREKRPLGRVHTSLRVQTDQLGSIQADHTTMWLWEAQSGAPPNWFLVADEIREKQLGPNVTPRT